MLLEPELALIDKIVNKFAPEKTGGLVGTCTTGTSKICNLINDVALIFDGSLISASRRVKLKFPS